LEPDFNDQLSATKRPSAAAPRACDIVATAVGSGGEFAYWVHKRVLEAKSSLECIVHHKVYI